MKKIISSVALVGMMVLGFAIYPNSSPAGIDIHVGVSLPPLVISVEPVVAVIPGTYVYFCPEVEVNLFFYDGYWYRPDGGNCYRSVGYNGPWVYVVYTA